MALVGSAIGEVKDALDSPSPAYFLGAKVSDAATTLPGLFFGGEGAAIRTGLPAETVTEGGAPLAIVRGWEPTGGMAWDDFASQFGTPQARNYPLMMVFRRALFRSLHSCPRVPSSTGSDPSMGAIWHLMAPLSQIAPWRRNRLAGLPTDTW